MNKIIKLVIGIFLLAFIIYKVGLSKVVETISNINLFWLLPVIAIYLIALLIGAYNIFLLLSINKNRPGYLQVLWYYIISYSVGLFTPANLGEFYIARLLKNHKIKVSHGLVVSVLDKMITIFTMIIISLIGIIIFFKEVIKPIIPVTILILFVIFIATLSAKFSRDLLGKLFKKKIRAIESGYSLLYKFKKKRKNLLVINFFITIVKLLITTVGIHFVFLSLDFKIPFMLIFFTTIAARLISLIPITYDGLGIKEPIAILMYGVYSIPAVAVVSMYLIYLIINYLLGFFTLIIFLYQTSNK